jgi:hypothetical protein
MRSLLYSECQDEQLTAADGSWRQCCLSVVDCLLLDKCPFAAADLLQH